MADTSLETNSGGTKRCISDTFSCFLSAVLQGVINRIQHRAFRSNSDSLPVLRISAGTNCSTC